MNSLHPTPYPDINEVLNLLISSVIEILDDQFVGMYLYGSLSSGDFNPETSDIDFLVVTTDFLAEDKISKIEGMHHHIGDSGLKWVSKLEGAYVPKELIRRHNPHGAPCPTINEGRFYVAGLGNDWIIQRHIVREYGIATAGPDPRSLIDPVTPDEIRGSVTGILKEWWFPMLEDPLWLKNHGSEYHAYAILTMCRSLHALEHGIIVSKPNAARWAKETLDARWKDVIDKSILAQKPGKEKYDLYNDAIDLIRYTKNSI